MCYTVVLNLLLTATHCFASVTIQRAG